MALTYFINRKKTTCVISFKGSISPNDTDVLDACLKEVMVEPARYCILNMAGLREVEMAATRPFTLFQQGLRSGAKLILCDLQPEVGRTLKGGGLVREAELQPDLLTSLQAILNAEKG